MGVGRFLGWPYASWWLGNATKVLVVLIVAQPRGRIVIVRVDAVERHARVFRVVIFGCWRINHDQNAYGWQTLGNADPRAHFAPTSAPNTVQAAIQ